ncbi:MAG: hypothetical protein ACR2H5_14775 [Ktedonobacteraceae bacterium]
MKSGSAYAGKHVLNRGNFTSIQDLKQKIQRYVLYYNEYLAKVCKWSAVKTKDVQTLIDKVRRIEINQCAEGASVGV